MALEHRYLVSLFVPQRIQQTQVVMITSQAPTAQVVDYYRALVPHPERLDTNAVVLALDDPSPRSVAAKLLDRPEIIYQIKRLIRDLPAVIEPWNVTDAEVEVAERLQIPINGTPLTARRYGFKSAGRRLFREAGASVADGFEDLFTVEDTLAAIRRLQDRDPNLRRVVIKHDDSGAGDGNAVIDITDDTGSPHSPQHLRSQLEGLPDWYLTDLANGAVVEAFLTGVESSSPSAQVDLLPGGGAVVIATHEQVLGGPNDQVFLGCRFPASSEYSGRLAADALAIGQRYAALGVVGRISVDFMAVRDGMGVWHLYALEVNLRKGGTTHPYTALRNLVPGRYDAEAGHWLADSGGSRAYVGSDNCVDSAWKNIDPAQLVTATTAAGVTFNHKTGTGVILHMLDGLSLDGRFGAIAIGSDQQHAQALFDTVQAVAAEVAKSR